MHKIGRMRLKEQLEDLMVRHGINASTLSKISGVPKSTISDWLSGSNPKSIPQVKKVADHFGVSIDYLCFGESTNKNSDLEEYSDEINAGVFEVVLRRVKI